MKKLYCIRRKMIAILLIVATLIFVSIYIPNRRELISDAFSLATRQAILEKDYTPDGHTVDDPLIVLNPYEISPLTAIIAFETEKLVRPTIKVNGKDEQTTLSFTFDISKKHVLPIYGLYADSDNVITISFDDFSKDYKIKTDALPSNIAMATVKTSDRQALGNEWYFYTPSSDGSTVAYDINGDVRWYLSEKAVWDISRLMNGHLLVSTERLMNTPYYMTGLYEMDLLGKIHGEYSLPGGYHHDYYEMSNGNFLIASDNFDGVNTTVEDYVVEIDRMTGEIVKKFNLQDILPKQNTGNENWSSDDWFHNNAVWYDKKTNSILLSGRHADAVIDIDYDSGELRWILGDPSGWPDEYKHYFLKPVDDNFEWQWSQHAVSVTPEGYVFLFDNGNNKSKTPDSYVLASNSYSRGVLYKVDDYEMTVEQVWQFGKERGSKFYSPYISDVDYLSAGHYLIHSGGISYKDGVIQNQPAGVVKSDTLLTDTVEIVDDRIVFEISLPTNTYRVEKMPAYTKSDLYGVKKGGAMRVGTLGKTEIAETKTGILFGSPIDTAYEEHNISFEKQEDRLVFSGKFKENSNVRVVLVKDLEQKYYKMRVTSKPHSALCIAVFNEEDNESAEEINITRYINGEGLSGKYKLFVEIYDKIYDTGKSINFAETR